MYQSDDEESSLHRNPFIDDEVEDVELESLIPSCDEDERRSPDTQSSHSSDSQVISQYTEDGRNSLSDIERYVDFGSKGNQKRKENGFGERQRIET